MSEEISDDSKTAFALQPIQHMELFFFRDVAHLRFTENINAYGILLLVH